MPRPYVMPDVNDRSVNDPAVIMESAKVLVSYNQDNPEAPMERVVDSVKEYIARKALDQGWNDVQFVGSQAILQANVSVNKGS